MEFAAKDASPPTRGAAVALHGLAKAAQHNGATGIITDEINEKDGRLGVRIAYGDKARTLRVKPGNLRRVEACASFDERGVAPLLSLGSADAPWPTPERLRARVHLEDKIHWILGKVPWETSQNKRQPRPEETASGHHPRAQPWRSTRPWT